MIAKTLFIANILYTYTMNFLRREKGLRDHGVGSVRISLICGRCLSGVGCSVAGIFSKNLRELQFLFSTSLEGARGFWRSCAHMSFAYPTKPGPSAWGLACHPSVILRLQANRDVVLSASTRQIPVPPPRTGTQRALRLNSRIVVWRKQIGDNHPVMAICLARPHCIARSAVRPAGQSLKILS